MFSEPQSYFVSVAIRASDLLRAVCFSDCLVGTTLRLRPCRAMASKSPAKSVKSMQDAQDPFEEDAVALVSAPSVSSSASSAVVPSVAAHPSEARAGVCTGLRLQEPSMLACAQGRKRHCV